jgi:hypothetical protein
VTDNVATLTVDLPTPIGYYPAGIEVLIISVGTEHTSICLDSGGFHPARRCHTATVPHQRIKITGAA